MLVIMNGWVWGGGGVAISWCVERQAECLHDPYAVLAQIP